MVDLDYSFIRLRETVEEAHNLNTPPLAENIYIGQVQLLSQDLQPYLQITNSPLDIIYSEVFSVFAIRCNDGEQFDITSSVDITPFTDVNGIDQIVFEIFDIQYDFGAKPVYLHFQFETQNLYSNNILISNTNQELTTRFDYRSDPLYQGTDYENAPYMQSIRLNTYFKEYVSKDELTPYYQVSRGQIVNQRVNQADLNRYMFSYLDGWTAMRLKRMLYGDTVYITKYNDSLGIRNYMAEAFEMPPLLGKSNVAQATFLVDPDGTDTYMPQKIFGLFLLENEEDFLFQNGNNFVL